MSLGTPYIGNLTPVDTTVDGHTVMSNLTPAQLKTAYPSNGLTATANFNIFYKGEVLSFVKGYAYNLDDGVLAAINAAFSNSPPLA